ncbi:MAG: HAMP domain-containing sensor histidine kinase, partial [Emcibacteraceae bacterium]|nr:HAMP domain-containing sensor histidine kinase [Emcibacteraceae bacterium]
KEKKYIEYLKDIKESGKHLETVIDDILDISKIEANKWHLDEKEFDLEYCINASRKMIAQQAFDKEIKITCNLEKDIQVFGDETCIKRILINILSNSVKFTAAAGAIKIKTRIDQNKCLIISISDNGVGIAKNKLESVMLPFGQDEQVRDINKSGTGLGLAIVKELIELHGGSITLTSEEDVGTLVTLMLPSDRVII